MSKLDLTIVKNTNNHNSGLTEQYYMQGNTNIVATRSPTGNCQVGTVSNVNSILAYENPLEILKAIHSKTNKAQMLVDLNRTHVDKFKKLFPSSDIVFEQDYISTNSSNMTMLLVKTFSLN